MKTIIAIFLLSLTSAGQTARTPTVTRTVQLLGDLERKIEAADSSGKAQLLTEDFEERLCAEPGTPISREVWLQKSATSDSNFTQEAVHSYGEIAVYSALRTQGQTNDMILDTWTQADGDWKVSVRYRCPATGTKPNESALPKRY
jgi:hypothetical protein